MILILQQTSKARIFSITSNQLIKLNTTHRYLPQYTHALIEQLQFRREREGGRGYACGLYLDEGGDVLSGEVISLLHLNFIQTTVEFVFALALNDARLPVGDPAFEAVLRVTPMRGRVELKRQKAQHQQSGDIRHTRPWLRRGLQVGSNAPGAHCIVVVTRTPSLLPWPPRRHHRIRLVVCHTQIQSQTR